jgi:hypothetical protein
MVWIIPHETLVIQLRQTIAKIGVAGKGNRAHKPIFRMKI